MRLIAPSTPLDLLLAAERETIVLARLIRIPERQRNALLLRLYGYTLDEVGRDVGGVTRERARQLIALAMRQIREVDCRLNYQLPRGLMAETMTEGQRRAVIDTFVKEKRMADDDMVWIQDLIRELSIPQATMYRGVKGVGSRSPTFSIRSVMRNGQLFVSRSDLERQALPGYEDRKNRMPQALVEARQAHAPGVGKLAMRREAGDIAEYASAEILAREFGIHRGVISNWGASKSVRSYSFNAHSKVYHREDIAQLVARRDHKRKRIERRITPPDPAGLDRVGLCLERMETTMLRLEDRLKRVEDRPPLKDFELDMGSLDAIEESIERQVKEAVRELVRQIPQLVTAAFKAL